MNFNFNINIFSKNINELFNNYSTIESNHKLKILLCNFFDVPSNYFDNIENIKPIYNYFILKYYPNETTIKANFINKELLKGKTHVTIFELPVGESRVDLCKINGTSIAYEIKTELDNFNRLGKQIYDYSLVFEKVFLICSSESVSHTLDILPEYCGIYIYNITKTGNVSFKLYRKANLSPNVNSSKQLSILTKKELLNISKAQNKLSLTKEELLLDILNNNSFKQINLLFKTILKNRYKKNWTFIKNNHEEILEIDYQWFFKNCVAPSLIYNK